jgi:tRNA modification GTPase
MTHSPDTIAALATPVGTAAIALLRISGKDTRRIAAAITGRLPAPRVASHVDYRDRQGALLDDVVLTRYEAPRSYTGEDALEISCHGNPFIAQKILEDLLARGCRPAEPGEFTQRAFLNGRMDLSQAEAVMDLIHARSERALAAANDQLRGALGRRIQELIDTLLDVLARVEAYIDFPDEDLPPEDRHELERDLAGMAATTARLLATNHYGNLLRDGIKTVIVGAPNVGKSSLLNRLVGRERALVSPEPGTTRDFIEERIIVGPHCLRIIDTAGLNPSPAPLEKLGMAKTRERLAEADLCLWVFDATAPEFGYPPEWPDQLPPEALMVVINKMDAVTRPPVSVPVLGQASTIYVSAKTGAGMAELIATIVGRADAFQTRIGGDAIAINARHAQALIEAREGLAGALAKLNAAEPAELLASDLRMVLAAFEQIIGKVDNERMLDQLFRSFCIGK